ncbi:MAG: hypothetical protein IKN66_11805 [Ruminococcus sp.]|nr:hypothetical protein [Ruminococcus sp.]
MDECISIFKAWLLSRDGIAIPVYKHPNPKYQFDEIILLSKEYGDEGVKELCSEYESSPSGSLQDKIVSYYHQNWCKVRAWGIFNEELTFRICPDSLDWYPVIVGFLLEHPMFRKSLITVETDTQYTAKYTFYDKIGYDYAVDKKNAEILTNLLIKEL